MTLKVQLIASFDSKQSDGYLERSFDNHAIGS